MPYPYNDDIIREVRESNDIVDIISQYVQLKRTGSNYKGLCPFHNEKTPSFVVSPIKQMFHCFGCGEGGDVITFIMKYQNLDFVESLKILADRANIILEDKTKNMNIELEKTKNRLYEINREAAIYFYKNLFNNGNAFKYLLNRGINEETIKKFGIGYSPDSWNGLLYYLKGKNYSEDELEKAGLIIKHRDGTRYYDRFRNRIMFPIMSTNKKVIGFGGRTIDINSQPKYLNSPETLVFSKGINLYGLNIAKEYIRGQKIILVEGYMDVISLYRNGINYCVASLGTALTTNQVKLLKRYNAQVYTCYDCDEAGMKATDKALDILKEEGINPKVIMLGEGMDPDEYIKIYGSNEFKKRIDNALSYMDFKIQRIKLKYNISTTEGKIDFTKNIAKLLKQFKSPIELDAYIKKVSEDTNISIEAIKKEVFNKEDNSTDLEVKSKYIKSGYRYNNKENIKPVEYLQEPGHLIAEKELLKLILNDKNIYLNIKDNISPRDFLNSSYKKIAETVYKIFEENIDIDINELSNNFDQIEKNMLNELFDETTQMNQSEKMKAADDYVKKINYYKINIKRSEIKKQLKLFENKKDKTEGDVETFKELCLELIKIDQQLKTN
ncbi:DNA primase DnaG [Gottschalkia purinilytica]|uniref:DNA primase n=1 Tax=Gottschalkia purinilytica TaxID=1503 RepID=A0A0L0WCY7_GOTPU|nr:DNA primase [Gottschalkia purinilytica]KNF09333.1 DNA primase DnaG [Gottschalkia purinilytica]